MNYTVGAHILNHNGVGYTFRPLFHTIYREDAEKRMRELVDDLMLHGFLAVGDVVYLKGMFHSFDLKEVTG